MVIETGRRGLTQQQPTTAISFWPLRYCASPTRFGHCEAARPLQTLRTLRLLLLRRDQPGASINSIIHNQSTGGSETRNQRPPYQQFSLDSAQRQLPGAAQPILDSTSRMLLFLSGDDKRLRATVFKKKENKKENKSDAKTSSTIIT